jgi:hypothetical protein
VEKLDGEAAIPATLLGEGNEERGPLVARCPLYKLENNTPLYIIVYNDRSRSFFTYRQAPFNTIGKAI